MPPIVQQVLGTPGRPLEAAARARMEARFGHDFSRVRVHTDARAAEAADALNAHAFTRGRDIVFGRDQLTPGTRAGHQLLAHELAHVVQQEHGGSPTLMRQKARSQPVLRLRPGCTKAQSTMIDNARTAAAGRTLLALAMVRGWLPPLLSQPGMAGAMRTRASDTAKVIFGVTNPNMTRIEQTVARIQTYLSNANLQIDCAASNEPNCRMWEAYVVGGRPPIHLCQSLLQSQEQVTRRLTHEAAHLAGVAETGRESYGMVLDCATSFGGYDVADSWEHYIHCLSGQTPDQAAVITVPRPTTRPGARSKSP